MLIAGSNTWRFNYNDTTGGTNFDAKLRRQSLDAEDLLIGHIGGMDCCARGLKAAAKMIEDKALSAPLSARYAGWDKALPKGDFETLWLADGLDHNGRDALAQVRDRMGWHVPGIIVTGDTGPERLREAHAAHALLLHKPVPAQQLKQALSQCLAEPQPESTTD